MPGGGVAFGAVREDQPGRRDVERQTQHGGDEEHSREGGEIERPLNPKSDHEDQHGEGDREGEPDVDQDRGQRHEEDGEDENDRKRESDILAGFYDSWPCYQVPVQRPCAIIPQFFQSWEARQRSLRENAGCCVCCPLCTGIERARGGRRVTIKPMTSWMWLWHSVMSAVLVLVQRDATETTARTENAS